MRPTTRKMSTRHERDVAEVLDGDQTRGSGSSWIDKGDGHQRHREGHYRFTWDAKSTLGQSLSVTREMWTKIEGQAVSMFAAIPLRFYTDERLTTVAADLIVVDLDVFAAMQRDANAYHQMIEEGVVG